MLSELHVHNLGVVEDANLILGPGMTVITGETGAGKTLLTEAIRLLMGGKSEAHMIRSGAEEARVEGRFVTNVVVINLTDEDGDNAETATLAEEHEVVIRRVLPATGRSRAYVDARMTPVSLLQAAGEKLVDLHGQHAHQSLLSTAAQRRSLDAFGSVDLSPLVEARQRIQQIDVKLKNLGGDARTRARELDLLKFQMEELSSAALIDADEDARLLEEENQLADAEAHREAAHSLHDALAGDAGVTEKLAAALAAASGRQPLASMEQRIRGLVAEVDDIALESAGTAASMVDDPQRLAEVQDRRAILKALKRKYGPELADVLAFRDETQQRLDELVRHDEVVAGLEAQRSVEESALLKENKKVAAARRAAAPKLSEQVQVRLRELALPNARFSVDVGTEGAGDDVVFLLGPNPGMPMLPIAKAASGGELARSMLALRLALLNVRARENEIRPDTLIFDEVDAGIGGEAAVAVGRALADVAHGSGHAAQVLVVTHLAQVAAFADHQITVEKVQDKDRTAARIRVLSVPEREVELARMLSGSPDSESGRLHARELLEQAHGVATSAGSAKAQTVNTAEDQTSGAKAKDKRSRKVSAARK